MARFVIVIVVAALLIAGGVRAGLHFGWIVTEPTFSSIIIVFLTLTTPITLMLLVRAALYRDREEGSDVVPRSPRRQ